MTVILKTGLTCTSLVTGLWQDAPHIHHPDGIGVGVVIMAKALDNAGFKLELTPSVCSIIADTGEEMSVVATVKLKADALKLAMKNKVGNSVKDVLRNKIRKMLDQAYAKFLEVGGPEPTIKQAYMTDFKDSVLKVYFGTGGQANKIAAITKLRKYMMCSLKFAKNTVEQWVDEYHGPLSEGVVAMNHETILPASIDCKYASVTDEVVDLVIADNLHQPVRGTNVNSRYYIVALGTFVKVAVRIRNSNDISIRALCTAGLSTKEQDETIEGFKRSGLEATSGDHWSLHLKPKNITMAERSIGSTLFAMGLPFTAVTGDLKALVGK